MKPELLALFDDNLRQEAAERFSLNPASLRILDGFENVVLEASRNGTLYILRLSHGSHRTIDQIRAELDWIDYLSHHGVSVCKPLRSQAGELVESLGNDHSQFISVCFEKAAGGPVRRDDWTRAMTYNRGKLLGRMHALTTQYRPPSERIKRYAWYDEDDFVNYREYLPPGSEVVAERFAELQTALRAIPTDNGSYGLIHMDAHTGNMFFDGDRPTLFDFDDCSYDFFISDIAISLFYAALMYPSDRDQLAFSSDFLNTLLEGYRSEYHLDNRWSEVIPMILKRREIVLYVAIHRGYDSANFDDWCRRYLDGRREKIEKRIPFLDLDWSRFDLGG